MASYQGPRDVPWMDLVEQKTFSELIEGREEEFPVLALATAHSEPAKHVKITWVNFQGEEQHNYTQIVRFAYTEIPVPEGSLGPEIDEHPRDVALTYFLSAIETILVHGVPEHNTTGWMPRSSCGGVMFYLGRKPVIGDVVKLRPLREPMLRTILVDQFGVPYDTPRYEWLAEFSLEVYSPRTTRLSQFQDIVTRRHKPDG